jgi:tetratricopeptide (TPR) repeat protein
MSNCTNCKKDIKDLSVYCNQCGTKIKPSLLDNHVSLLIDIGGGLKIPTNPITFEHCHQIGANAYHAGEFYEAIEYLKKALTFMNPPLDKLSNCYNELGISYLRLNQNTTAVNYLKLAISANPESITPHQNLVSALCGCDTDKAIDEFKKLVIKFPDFNKLLWRSLGISCENEKRYVEAKMFYENAIMNGINEAEVDLQDVIRKMNR